MLVSVTMRAHWVVRLAGLLLLSSFHLPSAFVPSHGAVMQHRSGRRGALPRRLIVSSSSRLQSSSRSEVQLTSPEDVLLMRLIAQASFTAITTWNYKTEDGTDAKGEHAWRAGRRGHTLQQVGGAREGVVPEGRDGIAWDARGVVATLDDMRYANRASPLAHPSYAPFVVSPLDVNSPRRTQQQGNVLIRYLQGEYVGVKGAQIRSRGAEVGMVVREFSGGGGVIGMDEVSMRARRGEER